MALVATRSMVLCLDRSITSAVCDNDSDMVSAGEGGRCANGVLQTDKLALQLVAARELEPELVAAYDPE
jgi:hypothetical protein